MNDSENKKTPEALADEALNQVAGGVDETKPDQVCFKCFKHYYSSQLELHDDGNYYCPDCGVSLFHCVWA